MNEATKNEVFQHWIEKISANMNDLEILKQIFEELKTCIPIDVLDSTKISSLNMIEMLTAGQRPNFTNNNPLIKINRTSSTSRTHAKDVQKKNPPDIYSFHELKQEDFNLETFDDPYAYLDPPEDIYSTTYSPTTNDINNDTSSPKIVANPYHSRYLTISQLHWWGLQSTRRSNDPRQQLLPQQQQPLERLAQYHDDMIRKQQEEKEYSERIRNQQWLKSLEVVKNEMRQPQIKSNNIIQSKENTTTVGRFWHPSKDQSVTSNNGSKQQQYHPDSSFRTGRGNRSDSEGRYYSRKGSPSRGYSGSERYERDSDYYHYDHDDRRDSYRDRYEEDRRRGGGGGGGGGKGKGREGGRRGGGGRGDEGDHDHDWHSRSRERRRSRSRTRGEAHERRYY